MDDLEKIREKKLKELMEKQTLEKELLNKLRTVVDEKGFERLMNIKAVNEQRFQNVANYLIMLAQRIGRPLTEKEVIKLLENISRRKEGKIRFVRK